MVWPGFVVAWRGQQAIIHSAPPGSGWVAGSVLSACDGRPFAAFARERIIKQGGRPAEDGQWWRRVPTLLYSSTTDVPAQRCTLVQPDGQAVTRDLGWGAPPADLTSRLQAAGEGETLPVGLTRAAEGIWWIALPSFAPDVEQKKAYDQLYADLEARQADLASARAVVIDLRGNQGGSSQWSKQVASRLWGEDTVEARLADFFNLVSIAWRASADNLAHIRSLRVQLADQPDLVAWLEGADTGLAAALEASEPYWIEREAVAPDEAEGPSPVTSFYTPVYVITGGPCPSACLDTVDVFTRFGGVTLMGAPTSADTLHGGADGDAALGRRHLCHAGKGVARSTAARRLRLSPAAAHRRPGVDAGGAVGSRGTRPRPLRSLFPRRCRLGTRRARSPVARACLTGCLSRYALPSRCESACWT